VIDGNGIVTQGGVLSAAIHRTAVSGFVNGPILYNAPLARAYNGILLLADQIN